MTDTNRTKLSAEDLRAARAYSATVVAAILAENDNFAHNVTLHARLGWDR